MRLRVACAALGLALWLGVSGCSSTSGAGTASPPRVARGEASGTPRAEAWPAADALFRQDPRWLGGDAAVSIPLDGVRVLWLFGDSFVAPDRSAEATRDRRGATMVRNSVAVQHGLDPERAQMRFVFPRTGKGQPASFFPERDGRWLWPQHGVLIAGQLTLFMYALESDPSSALGFAATHSVALRIERPAAEPEDWRPVALELPDALSSGRLVGVSVVRHAGYVYAYTVREPGDHALFLYRWTEAQFVRGELSQPESYTGDGHFARGPPVALLDGGQTELSIVPLGGQPERLGTRRSSVLITTEGFGAAELAVRFAPSLAGPFGPARTLYRSPLADRSGILIYAARAHPEQRGDGLAVTYATNSIDPDALYDDLEIYFPRFVRVHLR